MIVIIKNKKSTKDNFKTHQDIIYTPISLVAIYTQAQMYLTAKNILLCS